MIKSKRYSRLFYNLSMICIMYGIFLFGSIITLFDMGINAINSTPLASFLILLALVLIVLGFAVDYDENGEKNIKVRDKIDKHYVYSGNNSVEKNANLNFNVALLAGTIFFLAQIIYDMAQMIQAELPTLSNISIYLLALFIALLASIHFCQEIQKYSNGKIRIFDTDWENIKRKIKWWLIWIIKD